MSFFRKKAKMKSERFSNTSLFTKQNQKQRTECMCVHLADIQQVSQRYRDVQRQILSELQILELQVSPN